MPIATNTKDEETEAELLAICESFGHYDDGNPECDECPIADKCFQKGVV